MTLRNHMFHLKVKRSETIYCQICGHKIFTKQIYYKIPFNKIKQGMERKSIKVCKTCYYKIKYYN